MEFQVSLDNKLKGHIRVALMNDERQAAMIKGFTATLSEEFKSISPEEIPQVASLLMTSWLSGVWELMEFICGTEFSDEVMIDAMAHAMAREDLSKFEEYRDNVQRQVSAVRVARGHTFPSVTSEGSDKLH